MRMAVEHEKEAHTNTYNAMLHKYIQYTYAYYLLPSWDRLTIVCLANTQSNEMHWIIGKNIYEFRMHVSAAIHIQRANTCSSFR